MSDWNTWDKTRIDLTYDDVMQACVSGVWSIEKLRAEMIALEADPLTLNAGDKHYLGILQVLIGNYDSHPF